LVLLIPAISTPTHGQCPGVPPNNNDAGICDTIYVEPWSADTLLEGSGPYFVRVPIYLTHDIPVDSMDSIAGMAIPLCYTHNNTSKYCSLSNYWNTPNLSGSSLTQNRSIFRHLEWATGDTIHNWMLTLKLLGDEAEDGPYAWANIILNLDGTSHFWLAMVPTTQPLFWAGSKLLLATMTFKLEDSMHICIDSCLWPPYQHLYISRYYYGQTFVPRMGGLPYDTSSYHVCYNFRKPADVKEILNSDNGKPSQFSLSQNYPNPFNPVTNFQFTLPKSAHVRIDVFNIVGQKVKTLLDEEMKPGVYVVDWDGKDMSGNPVSSGIYFYKIRAGDFSDTKRMVLLK